jgi:hypothetical protein
MMLLIKTIILGLLVSLLALGANAELRHGNKMNVQERVLLEGGSGPIYDIIDAALDLARKVTLLCTSSAIENEDVQAFCDDAF